MQENVLILKFDFDIIEFYEELDIIKIEFHVLCATVELTDVVGREKMPRRT